MRGKSSGGGLIINVAPSHAPKDSDWSCFHPPWCAGLWMAGKVPKTPILATPGWESTRSICPRLPFLPGARSSSHSSGRRKIVGKVQTMASRWSSSAAGRASFEAHREKAQLATILAEGPGHELDPNSASFASDLFGCIGGSTWRICCHGNPDHADWTYIADTHWPVVFNRPACRSIFHGAVLRVYGGGHFARLADQTGISARAGMRLQPDRGGVAGLNLGSYVASLAAAALFGCGLGQVLSATNLGVAEVAKARRVAALSILNLMWGMGAIASSPLGMLAGGAGQRHCFSVRSRLARC